MMKKAVRALVGIVSYIVILLATYYINIRFFRVNVVGFTALVDAVIAAVIAGALLFVLKWFRAMEKFERILLVVIYLLGGFGFAVAIPTVIDRSLSLYILQKLDQRGGGIKQDQIGWVFVNESGTVVIKDGCVILTDKGRLLAEFSTWFHEYMLPKQRLLNGQYTDDLTNTFRNSVPSPGYECT
jgi:hypothetical protein